MTNVDFYKKYLILLGYPAYVVACVLKLFLDVDFVISVWL